MGCGHLPDPDGLGLDELRVICDQIDARVRDLLAELTPYPAA
jgi:hypothetical protein